MKAVEVDGKGILIVKTGTKFTAIGNKCTHMGCKLSGGKIDGETVRCPVMDRYSTSSPGKS
jgi:nitrite reductase/ring-hydroxylating ferredoxin subunit